MTQWLTDVETGNGNLQSLAAPWISVASDSSSYFRLQAHSRDSKLTIEKCLEVERGKAASDQGSAVKVKVLLGWNEPIDSTKFGVPANPKIDGKSLRQVISALEAGRDDGKLCTACHNNAEAAGGYGGPVAPNEPVTDLTPTTLIGNRMWKGADGWAVRFVNNASKPANVKAAIQAWIDNDFKE